MRWNHWRCAGVLSESELSRGAAFLAAAAPGIPIGVEVDEDEVRWSVRHADLPRLVAALDPEGEEFDQAWAEQIDEVEGDTRCVVIDLTSDDDGATLLTWDPKSGDNHATWPVAWLVATAFVRAVGAAPVPISIAYMLAPRPAMPPGDVLPVVPLRGRWILPSGKVEFVNIGRPASVAAIDAAVELHDGWCLCAVVRNPDDDRPPGLDELAPIACLVKVVKVLELSHREYGVLFAGHGRATLEAAEARAAEALQARYRKVGAGDPDPRIRPLVLDAIAQAIKFAIPSDDVADDARDVLGRLGPDALADGVIDAIPWAFRAEDRAAVLQQPASSERLMLVVEWLATRIRELQEALERAGGDLQTARLALVEDQIAELEDDDEDEDADVG
jgi:hypothetical protein